MIANRIANQIGAACPRATTANSTTAVIAAVRSGFRKRSFNDSIESQCLMPQCGMLPPGFEPIQDFQFWRDAGQIFGVCSVGPECKTLAALDIVLACPRGRNSAPYQGSFILRRRFSIEGDSSDDPIRSTPIGSLCRTFAQSEPPQLVASNWHEPHQTA